MTVYSSDLMVFLLWLLEKSSNKIKRSIKTFFTCKDKNLSSEE